MEKKVLDMRGSFCPYPVVETIMLIDDTEPGIEIVVLVDDPLAIKAIPEELENDNLKRLAIVREKHHWEIMIVK